MKEVLDRIEEVLMESARRRSARRRRRTVVAVAALAMLLLVSAASAVTGVGPLGGSLTSDENLGPELQPAPGGESVTLAAETAAGTREEVRAFRSKPRRTDIPGAYHYCVASYTEGKRGSKDALCTLGTALAIKLIERRLWLECSAGSVVVGQPKPPEPVCGLTLADTTRVEIRPDRGQAGEVQLSEPFPLRINRQPRIVRREGLDPDEVRALPPVVEVRAILGIVNARATRPGEREPRVTVIAASRDGERVNARVGGQRLPTRADVPSFDPRPVRGGSRANVSTNGPGGRRWSASTWRSIHGDVCASARPAGVPREPLGRMSMPGDRGLNACVWTPELGHFRSIVRQGATGFITRLRAPQARGSQAVYGFARADVRRLAVRDTTGRPWPAALSEPWTVWGRRANDLAPIPRRFRSRFAGLPRAVRLRAFIAVIPADAAPRYPVRLRFEARPAGSGGG
jgi:hypothetical protein